MCHRMISFFFPLEVATVTILTVLLLAFYMLSLCCHAIVFLVLFHQSQPWTHWAPTSSVGNKPKEGRMKQAIFSTYFVSPSLLSRQKMTFSHDKNNKSRSEKYSQTDTKYSQVALSH